MNDDNASGEFASRASKVLRASADDLDGATRARLGAARRAALDAAGRPGWLEFRYLAPAGAMAAAALATVLFIGGGPPVDVNDDGAAALYDLELLADADAFELSQENDLEFIEWAAAIAEQEGTGG